MNHATTRLLAALIVASAAPAAAASECKPHSLFTPMPGYHVQSCESSDFDARDIPVRVDEDGEPERKSVEGIYEYVVYAVDEGATVSSPLKILRNHIDAAKAKGGTVILEAGAEYHALGEWADIQQRTATLRIAQGGKEYWVHLGSVNDGDYYAIASIAAQPMAQEVTANELMAELDKAGFLTLQVHFDTAMASLRPESTAALDQAAELLRKAPAIKVEIAGHTDDAGNAAANLTLSEQRAASVRQALIERGIDAARLIATGYGDALPVADNRDEDGRARNRRVELVKR